MLLEGFSIPIQQLPMPLDSAKGPWCARNALRLVGMSQGLLQATMEAYSETDEEGKAHIPW